MRRTYDEKEEDHNKDKDMDVCMVPIEREEEVVLVLLSFVWFPSDNTLFIAPVINCLFSTNS